MKNLFIFLLLFTCSILNANCDWEKNFKDQDKIVKFNYERNPEKGWNNFGFDAGIRIYKETVSHYRFEGNSDCPNRCNIKFNLNETVDILHFGINIKSKDYLEFYPKFTFSLFNLSKYDNILCSKLKDYMVIKVLNFSSDVIYNREINWFQFGYGYGYDFINKLEKHIIPLIYLKFGYKTYKIDKNIFDKLSQYSSLEFSNFEVIGGVKFNLFYNPIALDCDVGYSKLIDAPNINYLTSILKLWLINQSIIEVFSTFSNEKFSKNYAVYLSGSYRKFYILGYTQDAFNFSLGFEYYFK